MVCRRRGKRRCAPRLALLEGVLLLDLDRGLALRPGELNSLVSNIAVVPTQIGSGDWFTFPAELPLPCS